MAETIRILVFGATGVGKTSLCNVLTGRKRATDSGAKGVTAKSHLYAPFTDQGCKIEVVDTVGLHEADSGTVPAKEAASQLVQLLEKSQEGFSLLVHVVRIGRITADHQKDYEFFVDKLTQRKIPVILVVTGCENEEPMSRWVQENQTHYRAFAYRQLLATCFAGGGPLEAHYAALRTGSRAAVLNAIHAVSLPAPMKLFGPGTGVSSAGFFAKVWNDLVELTGLPAKYRLKANESAYELMRRVGIPKEVADAAIKHLPDLAGELASKLPFPMSGPTVKILARKALEKLLRRDSGATANPKRPSTTKAS